MDESESMPFSQGLAHYVRAQNTVMILKYYFCLSYRTVPEFWICDYSDKCDIRKFLFILV